MKKLNLIIVFALCVMFASALYSQENQTPPEKENPMSSFMGMKWGTDALSFNNTFNQKYRTSASQNGFLLKNYKLGDIVLKGILFEFKATEGINLIFVRPFYPKFVFDSVIISYSPNDFETILSIFKAKYGEPTTFEESKIYNKLGMPFLQKTAEWIDQGIERKISLYKYASKIDEGIGILNKIDPFEKLKANDKAKAAAEQLRP